MRVTGNTKSGFPLDVQDLYNRGERVIRESIGYGVTVMRAHVEVDSIVRFACLDMALSLRRKYSALCDIQIAGAYTLRFVITSNMRIYPFASSLRAGTTVCRAR